MAFNTTAKQLQESLELNLRCAISTLTDTYNNEDDFLARVHLPLFISKVER
jgi:hypothetical protein